MLAAGQIEGGSAQGLGYALIEEVVMRDGRMANASLTNYIIPTTLDSPPMQVVMLKNPYKDGPCGAKGVGEMPIDGPAPAVINALRHAGFDLRQIPATPERIMAAGAAARCHAPDAERQAHAAGRASAQAAAGCPARRLPADGNEGGMRRRRVRRLHRARR